MEHTTQISENKSRWLGVGVFLIVLACVVILLARWREEPVAQPFETEGKASSPSQTGAQVGRVLRGEVLLEDGRPLEGVSVGVGSLRVRTSSRGTFETAHEEVDDFELELVSDFIGSVRVPVEAGQAQLTHVVQPAASVGVHISTPVYASPLYSVTFKGEDSLGKYHAREVLDLPWEVSAERVLQSHTFEDLLPGVYSVSGFGPGAQFERRIEISRNGERAVLSVASEVQRVEHQFVGVTGLVEHETGAFAGIELVVESTDGSTGGRSTQAVTTDTEGGFSCIMPFVESSGVSGTLRVRRPGATPVEFVVPAEAIRTGQFHCVVRFSAASARSLQLLTETNVPLLSGRAILKRLEAPPRSQGVPLDGDAEGRFEFDLEPGAYRGRLIDFWEFLGSSGRLRHAGSRFEVLVGEESIEVKPPRAPPQRLMFSIAPGGSRRSKVAIRVSHGGSSSLWSVISPFGDFGTLTRLPRGAVVEIMGFRNTNPPELQSKIVDLGFSPDATVELSPEIADTELEFSVRAPDGNLLRGRELLVSLGDQPVALVNDGSRESIAMEDVVRSIVSTTGSEKLVVRSYGGIPSDSWVLSAEGAANLSKAMVAWTAETRTPVELVLSDQACVCGRVPEGLPPGATVTLRLSDGSSRRVRAVSGVFCFPLLASDSPTSVSVESSGSGESQVFRKEITLRGVVEW